MDLEKEIEAWEDCFKHCPASMKYKETAKHFFELGLKAQNKITPLQQQRISVIKMEFWTGLQTFEETDMTLSDAYNQGIEDILEELGLKTLKEE